MGLTIKTVKYNSTVGLNASVPGYAQPKLVKIAHDQLADGRWKLCVESGHNLAMLKKCGVKYLSDEEFRATVVTVDDISEFRSLASLFDIRA